MVAITVCLWLVIRLARRTPLVKGFRESSAGLTALIASPLVYVYWEIRVYEYLNAELFFLEALTIATLWAAYVWRKPAPSDGSALAVITLHYVYWFWHYGFDFYLGPHGGAYPAALSLCATIAWFCYRKFVTSDSRL